MHAGLLERRVRPPPTPPTTWPAKPIITPRRLWVKRRRNRFRRSAAQACRWRVSCRSWTPRPPVARVARGFRGASRPCDERIAAVRSGPHGGGRGRSRGGFGGPRPGLGGVRPPVSGAGGSGAFGPMARPGDVVTAGRGRDSANIRAGSERTGSAAPVHHPRGDGPDFGDPSDGGAAPAGEEDAGGREDGRRSQGVDRRAGGTAVATPGGDAGGQCHRGDTGPVVAGLERAEGEVRAVKLRRWCAWRRRIETGPEFPKTSGMNAEERHQESRPAFLASAVMASVTGAQHSGSAREPTVEAPGGIHHPGAVGRQ